MCNMETIAKEIYKRNRRIDFEHFVLMIIAAMPTKSIDEAENIASKILEYKSGRE